jgi:hypothetical protein
LAAVSFRHSCAAEHRAILIRTELDDLWCPGLASAPKLIIGLSFRNGRSAGRGPADHARPTGNTITLLRFKIPHMRRSFPAEGGCPQVRFINLKFFVSKKISMVKQ